jgi:FkbM family methyltransferase
LRRPLKLIPSDTVLPVLQGRLKGKRWIVGSSNHGCWLGSFEYDKRRAFEEKVQPGSVVFDIGANVGFYTLLASVLVGPSGKVFAFEPHPQNLEYLRAHLNLNAVSNVAVMEKAVSDRDGVAFFAGSGSTGHLAAEGTLRVETVSLDFIIRQRALPPPTYAKIDVEGAESLVLAGAKSLLSDYHPTLFLATHGAEVHRECCQFLTSLDYEVRPLGSERLEEASEVIAFSREARLS